MQSKRMEAAVTELLLRHYKKILCVDLTEDRYSVLMVGNSEWKQKGEEVNTDRISDWFDWFAHSPFCAEGDRRRFKHFTNLNRLRLVFAKDPDRSISIVYKRKSDADDSTCVTVMMEMVPFADERGHQKAFLFVKNVSQEIEDYIASVGNYDSLTGLFTKEAFYRYAERTIKQNPDAKYTVSYSDFDDFKLINEKFGEEVGDRVLQIMADCLRKESVRKGMLAGRYSADKFVCMLPSEMGLDQDKYLELLDNCQSLVSSDNLTRDVRLSVKLGVYKDVDNSLPVSVICDRAILALKTIKGQYGSKVAWYNDKLAEQLEDVRQTEMVMQKALAEGEFKVYYQPKHDAKTGRLVGAEALVRWIQPDRGMVPPDRFIPLFERNGFITELDAYISRRVCTDIKDWGDSGYATVPVSVNLSRRDLLTDKSPDMLGRYIDKTGISRDLIHVEVTESMYVDDTETVIRNIERIRNQGIRVELDDFGAGYSSLGMLSELPMDTIKIDRSFVIHMEKQRDIIKAIILMAHTLGKEIIVEGVETIDELETLRELGCDTVQGYYYSKPISHDEFSEYMRQN